MTEDERIFRDWGFTNDVAQLGAVIRWRDAAMADGWAMEPTYGSEDASRACTLRRDGFVAFILTREQDPKRTKYAYEAKIAMWGPDGLAINAPMPYDMTSIRERVTTCLACGKTDVPTHRVGFAGRVCAECLPVQRKIHEYPGWTN